MPQPRETAPTAEVPSAAPDTLAKPATEATPAEADRNSAGQSSAETVELGHEGIDATFIAPVGAQKHWERRGWKPVAAAPGGTEN